MACDDYCEHPAYNPCPRDRTEEEATAALDETMARIRREWAREDRRRTVELPVESMRITRAGLAALGEWSA